jgi:hypothetical protein
MAWLLETLARIICRFRSHQPLRPYTVNYGRPSALCGRCLIEVSRHDDRWF